MEEDIKILESHINQLKEYEDEQELAQALENLIKGYRELEVFEQQVINHQNSNVFKCKNCIQKSKIKEKIEEINKSHGYSPVNKIFIEQVLQELLEEE